VGQSTPPGLDAWAEKVAQSPPGKRRAVSGKGGDLEPEHASAGISLLFAVGARPAASEIARLLAAAGPSGHGANVSHRPSDEHGWVELLASGLTFDLRGLAPGDAAPLPPVGHVYGLPADVEKFEFEAACLEPGAHIAAGARLMPVVRVMMGLAVDLALHLPVAAVCWNPAQSWMEPKYFGRIVANWLSGGPFPFLGLTGLRRRPDGVHESSGLAFFTEQEVCVPERRGEPASEVTKLAGRIIDQLVRHGTVERAEEFTGPSGEPLRAEPSPDGRMVMVARTG
jgi:hypothetical protein